MSETEDPINERINFLINELENGVRRRFALRIGVSPGMISDLFSERKNKPGLDMVRKILTKYPQISTDWLLLGEGEMLKKPAAPENPEPALKNNSVSVAEEPEPEYEPGKSDRTNRATPTFRRKGTTPAALPGTDLVEQVARNTREIELLQQVLETVVAEVRQLNK